MKHVLTCFFSLLLSANVWAAANAQHKIDGLWEAHYKTSDTPSAHVRIKTLPSGELTGVIEMAYPRPGENPSHNCIKCTGANKDKPIVGLKILWGMMPSGDNQWSGGHLLNAETGEIYSGTMTLSDNGDTLELTGYVFEPIFSKSSTWKRIK